MTSCGSTFQWLEQKLYQGAKEAGSDGRLQPGDASVATGSILPLNVVFQTALMEFEQWRTSFWSQRQYYRLDQVSRCVRDHSESVSSALSPGSPGLAWDYFSLRRVPCDCPDNGAGKELRGESKRLQFQNAIKSDILL